MSSGEAGRLHYLFFGANTRASEVRNVKKCSYQAECLPPEFLSNLCLLCSDYSVLEWECVSLKLFGGSM